MTILKSFGLTTLGLIIGGFLAWAYWSDRVALCQSEAVTLKAEHQAMAEALLKAEAKTDQAYQWIAESAAVKVDLTIPFKPLPKAEQVSSVQIETNEIAALAKFGTRIENKLKQGFARFKP